MQITPRAILFDLDGTLADTAPDLAAAINRVRIERGLAPAPYELLRPVASAGARGLIGAAFQMQPDEPGYVELRDAFLTHYEQAMTAESRLFDGVTEMLSELENLGIMWGIVTNKLARFAEPLARQIGLRDASCVISGDTTPHPKPHPAPLLEAARQINLQPGQCWYVGDDLRDIQSGKAAGMLTVAAAWGYCGHTEPAAWNADMIIGTPLALLNELRKTGS